MKQLLNVILSGLIAAVAVVMMSGCSDDVRQDGPVDSGYTTMVLSVSVPSPYDDTSRAAFDAFDNEKDKWGVDGENMETLRIVIVSSDGMVEHNALFDTENALHAGEYSFKVRKNDTKTIIFVANEGDYTIGEQGATTITDYFKLYIPGTKVDVSELSRLTLFLNAANTADGKCLSLKKPLPITAIYNETLGDDDDDVYREYDLHRAAVKYTFRIVNESKYSYTLDAVRISRIADREYLFPDADWTDGPVPGHRVISDYRTPEGTQEGVYYYHLDEPVVLAPEMTAAVEIPAFYVPEGLRYEQVDSVQRVSIALNGADFYKWNELKWTMPGESLSQSRPMTDLPRNTHVVINATLKDKNTMTLIADVQPYASVTLDPFFGFERDANGNIIVSRGDDGIDIVLVNGKRTQVDADGDKVILKFSDGSILCEEVVYKDYIYDSWEEDYSFIYEKTAPGGDMIIYRENYLASDELKYHAIMKGSGGMDDENPETHNHSDGSDGTVIDRPLFIFHTKGEFRLEGEYLRCEYDDDGNCTTTNLDIHGNRIIQVNGYQYRPEQSDSDFMYQYLGTYLASDPSDGNKVGLYRCRDGERLSDWPPAGASLLNYSCQPIMLRSKFMMK